MALTLKQVNDVCLIDGGHKECRYLEDDENMSGKFFCKKKSPDKKHIDDLVSEYLHECKVNGDDPIDGGVALGDNCGGYLCFKDIPQGYDVED
jgi:hypothetical protein